jgi:polysaccharide export outer membrane protein
VVFAQTEAPGASPRDGKNPRAKAPQAAAKLVPGDISKAPGAGQGDAAETDAVAARTGTPPVRYEIGAGDVLEINVWKEPEASAKDATVRSDGRISLPIIKEVDVLGLTPAQLEKRLTERFAEFIHEPQVTVLVKSVNSEKVYLVGGLKKEGSIRFQTSMTVLQALAEGGGLTDFAKKKNIYVLRNVNNKQVRLPFNYEAVIKGAQAEQNFLVWPGDTIVVPQ